MFNLLRMNANEITHSSKNNRTDSTPRRLKLRRLSLLCLLVYCTRALPVCLCNCRQSRRGEASQFMTTGGGVAVRSVRIYLF